MPSRRTSFPGLQQMADRRREVIEELGEARPPRGGDGGGGGGPPVQRRQPDRGSRADGDVAVRRRAAGERRARRADVHARALHGRRGPHRRLAGPTRRGAEVNPISTWPPLPPEPPDPPRPPRSPWLPEQRPAAPGPVSVSSSVEVHAPDWLAERLVTQRVVALAGELDAEAANRAIATPAPLE